MLRTKAMHGYDKTYCTLHKKNLFTPFWKKKLKG